ncbi:MAG: YggS family pyridoxal phosphate-dependent enzyme [Myxococcales bacterium]|nr:YggS family pyridoxal phosphate-dependent enzyme [Myxococcales bacterium]
MSPASAHGVAERLRAVQRRISSAAAAADRDPSEIHLVAVSKRQPVEAIREAYALGQRLFGENYVQELAQKAAQLSDLEELRWHFIGHLQRNKVKEVLRAGAFIETLDSPRLAAALGQHARASDLELSVLVQVNLGGEAQKFGCSEATLGSLIELVGAEEGLRLEGLMTVPPLAQSPEASRPIFRRLRELAQAHGLRSLSMGMSADLEVAVQEGATHLRVGTAIFGPRPA